MENNIQKTIRLSEIPPEKIELLGRQLYLYTVGFIRIKEDEKGAFQAGSGILIDINGIKGILTAKHVSTNLLQHPNDELGFLLDEAHSHRTTINISYLSFYQFSLEQTGDLYFPDISFISLPLNLISTIETYKSFYKMSFDRNTILNLKDDFLDGVWYICGFPEWDSTIDIGTTFNKIISIYGICGATGVTNQYKINGYDYYEAIVDYDTSGESIPLNFGGISGGGLWKVTFNIDFSPKEYSLSGLIISQSIISKENKRKLVCLGRESLYHHFYEYLCKELGVS